MGWSYASLKKITNNRDLFANKRVLTLGTLYPYLTHKEMKLLKSMGVKIDVEKRNFSRHFFEDFLKAECCHSLDVSDYQDSEIICNLNSPLLPELRDSYDVVIDAGTLEHVSNMSVGLTNMFKLLKNGGIYYFGLPSNNWVDHGFFQFSPTFFKDLCIDNKNLELLELFISDDKSSFDITNSSLNANLLRLMITSSNKLNVGGIIRKLDSEISIDLVQTKYRNVYESLDESRSNFVEPSQSRFIDDVLNLIKALIFWVFSIPIISLKHKERIINLADKIRRR